VKNDMTIIIPEKSLADRILLSIGKNRAIYLPQDNLGNPYLYSQARKEPFFRALFRQKNTPLPHGWVYIDKLKIV